MISDKKYTPEEFIVKAEEFALEFSKRIGKPLKFSQVGPLEFILEPETSSCAYSIKLNRDMKVETTSVYGEW